MKINYKIIAIIPIILTILSGIFVYAHGLKESIDVSGGSEITITAPNNVDIVKLKNMLPKGVEVKKSQSASGTFIIIRAGKDVDTSKIDEALRKFFNVNDLNELQYSQKQIGASLSEKFWTDGFKAVGFAFVFMAIVVYLVFRTPIPSGAVILAAMSDIIIAIGGMSLFGIPVSTSTVAALLMLIGYSVDTDIMLTTRVLKRRAGTLDERIRESMKTGITMSITTIVAMFVLYLVVTYIVPAASLLKDISVVILFGLIADLMTTWMTNAGILRYYVSEYKKKGN
ncbi:protein translocase subunit SecF [Methanothermococcus okinawensis]|uniref:Protein-export membrane protein SecF n=1 Tax=Methanothermococcus okinawensis (strain DSM 14208 / JCM 11175 / IH1) TaxID=647113 RepID=F8ALD9_METOI|nr:protein translocase subunit SecF [Methanothermococcus okinawensis]AEH06527.1 SecD/SecF/SecDF export membrane protein [Methanothermococcus okinawensis IH1]